MREYASSSALNSESWLAIPAMEISTASAGPIAPADMIAICGQPPSVHVRQSLAASVATSGMR